MRKRSQNPILFKKNHDIAKNIIKKYEKFWLQNYVKILQF